MDATAILGLMSDLYAQVSRLTAENAALKNELSQPSQTDPSGPTERRSAP